MYRIVNADSVSPSYEEELMLHFSSQWQEKIPPLDGGYANCPSPLLALKDKSLIGGLAFTFYPHPVSEIQVLWINAVLVLPQWRGQGVASELIKAAEVKAARAGSSELFVYSDVPKLYTNLGWSKVTENKKFQVLSKATGI